MGSDLLGRGVLYLHQIESHVSGVIQKLALILTLAISIDIDILPFSFTSKRSSCDLCTAATFGLV